MIGVDGAGSVDFKKETFGTRFEIAYNIPDNSRVSEVPAEHQADLTRNNFIQAVIGVDHTLQKKVYGTVLYLNMMYIHAQNTTDRNYNPGALTLEGLPNFTPFDRNLVLYVEDRITPELKVSNAFLGSFENIDGVNSTSVSYSFTDNFKSSVGFDWFLGRQTGFYGQYSDNSRYTLNVSYTF